MYGMSYDEYWYAETWRAVPYREAHRLHIEEKNQQLWMQGLYIYNAVSVALNNAFSKQKQKYIQEPIRIFPPTEDERKAQIEEDRRKLKEKLSAWKKAFDAKGKK